MISIEVERNVTYVEYAQFSRDEVIDLIREHDPKSDPSGLNDDDLAVLFAATLNEYQKSPLHDRVAARYLSTNHDLTSSGDWSGKAVLSSDGT